MSVQDYMRLPCSYIIKPIQDESGSHFNASMLRLDGSPSTGETFQEAYDSPMEAMAGRLEAKLENGFAVPAPLAQRLPKVTGRCRR